MGMKIFCKGGSILLSAAIVLSSVAWVQAESAPMTPQLATKTERVKRQQSERITPTKRRAAAEALKQQKLKLLKAREGAEQSNPPGGENKHHKGGNGGDHGK